MSQARSFRTHTSSSTASGSSSSTYSRAGTNFSGFSGVHIPFLNSRTNTGRSTVSTVTHSPSDHDGPAKTTEYALENNFGLRYKTDAELRLEKLQKNEHILRALLDRIRGFNPMQWTEMFMYRTEYFDKKPGSELDEWQLLGATNLQVFQTPQAKSFGIHEVTDTHIYLDFGPRGGSRISITLQADDFPNMGTESHLNRALSDPVWWLHTNLKQYEATDRHSGKKTRIPIESALYCYETPYYIRLWRGGYYFQIWTLALKNKTVDQVVPILADLGWGPTEAPHEFINHAYTTIERAKARYFKPMGAPSGFAVDLREGIYKPAAAFYRSHSMPTKNPKPTSYQMLQNASLDPRKAKTKYEYETAQMLATYTEPNEYASWQAQADLRRKQNRWNFFQKAVTI